jgi:predicted signal transduction protein with EAL and GGDEF domain
VPVALAGISYEIGAQIGMALSPQHGSEYNALLRKADVALYQATEAGVNLAVYDPARDPHTPQRLALIGASAMRSNIATSACTASPRSTCARARCTDGVNRARAGPASRRP